MKTLHLRTCSACKVEKPLEQFSKKLKGLQPNCKPCSAAQNRAYHAAKKDARNAASKAYYEANRETALEKQREYYAANAEKIRAYVASWRKENPGYAALHYKLNADVYRERVKTWREENPCRRRAQEVARRSRARRIPPWADREAMAAIYAEARRLRRAGFDCHVDHEIPLKGRNVSGLHVHTNLRIIPAEENLKKGAKALP